ncbi:hypothetical protein HK405_004270 [Cladochytrium tenue]|nr:hypothetical protein HK405_004270 [Cladochytrium tenue]
MFLAVLLFDRMMNVLADLPDDMRAVLDRCRGAPLCGSCSLRRQHLPDCGQAGCCSHLRRTARVPDPALECEALLRAVEAACEPPPFGPATDWAHACAAPTISPSAASEPGAAAALPIVVDEDKEGSCDEDDDTGKDERGDEDDNVDAERGSNHEADDYGGGPHLPPAGAAVLACHTCPHFRFSLTQNGMVAVQLVGGNRHHVRCIHGGEGNSSNSSGVGCGTHGPRGFVASADRFVRACLVCPGNGFCDSELQSRLAHGRGGGGGGDCGGEDGKEHRRLREEEVAVGHMLDALMAAYAEAVAAANDNPPAAAASGGGGEVPFTGN